MAVQYTCLNIVKVGNVALVTVQVNNGDGPQIHTVPVPKEEVMAAPGEIAPHHFARKVAHDFHRGTPLATLKALQDNA